MNKTFGACDGCGNIITEVRDGRPWVFDEIERAGLEHGLCSLCASRLQLNRTVWTRLFLNLTRKYISSMN